MQHATAETSRRFSGFSGKLSFWDWRVDLVHAQQLQREESYSLHLDANTAGMARWCAAHTSPMPTSTPQHLCMHRMATNMASNLAAAQTGHT
jgi:hypothetical protein